MSTSALELKQASLEKARIDFEKKQKAFELALLKSEEQSKIEAEKKTIKSRWEADCDKAKTHADTAKKLASKAQSKFEQKSGFIKSFGDGIESKFKASLEYIVELDLIKSKAEIQQINADNALKAFEALSAKNMESYINDSIEAGIDKIERLDKSLVKAKTSLEDFKTQAQTEGFEIIEGSDDFKSLNSDSRKAIKMACKLQALDFTNVKKTFVKTMATFEGKGSKTVCKLTTF